MTVDAGRFDLADLTDASALRGRRVLVLGLARSGVAAARMAADAGAQVTVYDRRSETDLAGSIALLGDRRIDRLLGAEPAEVRAAVGTADLLITSPSISARFPTTDPWLREVLAAAEATGIAQVSEVDLFLRLTHARLIGVTGTKGKTTTASLIAAILRSGGLPVVLGGNIGTPLVEEAETLTADSWAVLELSELQLPTISRGVDIAVYTNIAADHLDRHLTVESYRAVKARLAELTMGHGPVLLNADDAGCRELADRLVGADVRWYGTEAAPDLQAWLEDGWLVIGGEQLMPTTDIPLPGAHLRVDALAAALTGHLAGVPLPAIRTAIAAFPGVRHRLETITTRRGVRWVNDSQATIPLAAIAALEAFNQPLVVIAGGASKGLPLEVFAEGLARRAREVILIGETADELARYLAGRVPVTTAAGMTEAVEQADQLARPGDIVLLAPAAASFDQFTDYEARGDAFRDAVVGLGAEAPS